MFYKSYTHIDEIIEKVKDRFKFEDVPKDSAMENAWLALNNLGVSDILEDAACEVVIENYRGIMPSNLISLEAMREKESQIPLIPSKDIFIDGNLTNPATSKTYVAGYTVTGFSPEVPNSEADLEVNYAYIENYPESSGLNPGDSIGFQIRDGILWCEVANCIIEVAYKAFPIWDDGTPKIPDDSKVIDFLVDFIAYRVAIGLYMTDRLSRDKFEFVRTESYWSQGAARNKLLMPDKSMMEFMRRMQTRLIPKPEQFNTGFKYLGERERLK